MKKILFFCELYLKLFIKDKAGIGSSFYPSIILSIFFICLGIEFYIYTSTLKVLFIILSFIFGFYVKKFVNRLDFLKQEIKNSQAIQNQINVFFVLREQESLSVKKDSLTHIKNKIL